MNASRRFGLSQRARRSIAAVFMLGGIASASISAASIAHERPPQHQGEPGIIEGLGALLGEDWLQDLDPILWNTEATLFHVAERVVDDTTREQLHRMGREDRHKDAARTAFDMAIAEAEKALQLKWPTAEIRPSAFVIQYATGGERELVARVPVSQGSLAELFDSSDEKLKVLLSPPKAHEESLEAPNECDIQLIMYVGGGDRDINSPALEIVCWIVYEITPNSSKSRDLLRIETVRTLLRYSDGEWIVEK